MNNDIALHVEDLHVSIETDTATLDILHGLTFDIHKGETLGIVGESGCGKSMTALAIMRLTQKNARVSGRIELDGESLLDMPMKDFRHIRGNRVSMIFQEPMTSLNPVFTVGHQLMEVFRLHQGLNKKEAREKSIEALRMVNVPMPEKRVDCYPYELSGGLRQRVMIAMAMICNPKLLLADEPTTALDVTIEAQILHLMKQLQEKRGTAILLITHNLGVVAEICDYVYVMYAGKIVEQADVFTLFREPLHPYTSGLIRSIPKVHEQEGGGQRLYTIKGMVPNLLHMPEGCAFCPRCEHATERCRLEKPELYDRGDGHRVRCFLYEPKEEGEQ